MAAPRISVLMPFRDAAPYLGDCLSSIFAQTLDDFELIAVDDGSTDDSARLLRECGDARLRLVPARGRGIAAALQTGLLLARSPLVARMDADDVMHPTRLEKQASGLEGSHDLDLLACRVRAFPDEALRAGFRIYLDWQNACLSHEDIADEIYWESPLAHPSVAFRRDAVLRVGGYRQGPFPEDYDLWLRMLEGGCRMGKLPEVLLEWRERSERASRTDPRYGEAAFSMLRTDHLARDPRLARPRPLAFWGAGRVTRRRSRLLIERGKRPVVYVDVDRKKVGNRIDGIPVVSPAWLDRSERPFVLAWVRSHGARAQIAETLRTMGYARGRDYLMVG